MQTDSDSLAAHLCFFLVLAGNPGGLCRQHCNHSREKSALSTPPCSSANAMFAASLRRQDFLVEVINFDIYCEWKFGAYIMAVLLCYSPSRRRPESSSMHDVQGATLYLLPEKDMEDKC